MDHVETNIRSPWMWKKAGIYGPGVCQHEISIYRIAKFPVKLQQQILYFQLQEFYWLITVL